MVKKKTIWKLEDSEVLEIRRLLAKGYMSQRAIAERFDVSTTTINNIKRKVVWRSI